MKNSVKQKRKRGVILTNQGFEKLLAAKSEAESCKNSDKHYTLEALSDRTGLDPDTLTKVFIRQDGVDKRTLNRCFTAFDLELKSGDYQLPFPDEAISTQQPIQAPQALAHLSIADAKHIAQSKIHNQIDWGEAPDVSVFFGREEELATLKHWMLIDGCRLVTLLGMGGIGKTCLSVKLAHQIQDKFEFVIWGSLRNAPPVKDMLAQLILFLSNGQETDIPETLEGGIARLIYYLRTCRCLLVLDSLEMILKGCDYGVGRYHEGCEGYGQLFRQVAESQHQSCLLLTSREKPKGIGLLEGERLPARSLQLKGLQVEEGKEIFKAKGCFWGSPTDWSRLIERYAGNPLALKSISSTIQKLFDGNIYEFLKQNIAVFGDIRNLLEQQFKRLSDVEKEIIKWLAINRQPASFSELREKIPPSISPQKLLEALESLSERSLIEKKAALFFLQPVVMEFVSDQLREEKITQVPLRVVSSDEYPRLVASS
ncbi:NB-ARC domain-containing protein [Coleofasciculus sp. H7-2]|uniref:NB-ARC domain-containing protein n=1 Tax=Coleofasciculus sp. H7-2 TaxID=3351545 RepID=UPI00367202DC